MVLRPGVNASKAASGIFLGIQDDGAVNIETSEGLKQFYQGRLRRLETSL